MVNWQNGLSGAFSGASAGASAGGGWGALAGGIIGGAMGLFGSNNAAKAAQRQYEYQRLLNQQAYDLTMQGYREGPMNQRQGYEMAGINPIFAMSNGASFGSFSGGSASAVADSSTADLGNMATNAYKVFSLMRNKNTAEIASINAGIKNTDADTALKAQYAMTEQAKRTQMQFQNAMYDVQKHLAQKDLDSYDRRLYANLYNQFQQAENNRAMASVARYNAESMRMNSEANAYETQYRKEHPVYNWADRWGSVAGRFFGGAGYATNAYTNLKNSSKSIVTEKVNFDKNAVYKGHTRTTRRRR